jgi:hypothetical protein
VSGLWRNGPGGSPMPACQAVWCQCMLYLASTYHIINAHPAVPLCHAGGGGPSCLARSSSLRRGAEIARSSHHISHAAAGRGGVAVVVSGAGGAAVALGAARRRVGVGALRAAQARRLLVVVGVGPPRRAGAAPRRARRRVRAHPAVDARLRPASRASARPRYVSHHPLTDDDEEEDEEEDPAGTGTGTGTGTGGPMGWARWAGQGCQGDGHRGGVVVGVRLAHRAVDAAELAARRELPRLTLLARRGSVLRGGQSRQRQPASASWRAGGHGHAGRR